jgi:hypothetical protein
MNDLIESNRMVFTRFVTDILPIKDLLAEEEMQRYQQISFIQDRVHDGFEYLGFDLQTMWGLYAEKGYGACLVFDKNKLKLGDGDYARDVKYDNFVLADFVIKNKSKAGIKSEIWRRRNEFFSTSGRNGNMSRSTGLFVVLKTSMMTSIWTFPIPYHSSSSAKMRR